MMYKQAEFEDEDSSSIGSVALNSEGISTSATHIRYNSVSNWTRERETLFFFSIISWKQSAYVRVRDVSVKDNTVNRSEKELKNYN